MGPSAVDEVHKGVDLLVGFSAQKLRPWPSCRSGGSFERRLPSAERRRCMRLNWSVLARVCGWSDVLLTGRDFGKVSRHLAMRAPDVDLESERVLAWTGLDHPLQWRIGDETAVPVELAVNLNGGKPGGRAPLAITCSGRMRWVVLSK